MLEVEANNGTGQWSDYTLPPHITLICGQGGSGKTTFAIAYLLNVVSACNFIFDDSGQLAQRLRLPWVSTARQCEQALSTRWVCFNPHRMFPGNQLPDGFKWFCKWSHDASKRGPGKKVFYVDEIWQWTDAKVIPDELVSMVRTGRWNGLDFLSSTQRPSDYHKDIRAQVTEWICFRLDEPYDLDAVRPYFSRVDVAKTLLPGQFIAFNRQTQAIMMANLWTKKLLKMGQNQGF